MLCCRLTGIAACSKFIACNHNFIALFYRNDYLHLPVILNDKMMSLKRPLSFFTISLENEKTQPYC